MFNGIRNMMLLFPEYTKIPVLFIKIWTWIDMHGYVHKYTLKFNSYYLFDTLSNNNNYYYDSTLNGTSICLSGESLKGSV